MRTGERLELPKDLPHEIARRRSGVFVTIYKNGDLRGCMGTYRPTEENIGEELISSAVSTAYDPRFQPITEPELPDLTYEVSVLGEPEEAQGFADFDAKKYGMIIKTNSKKSALLLPDLEEVDTPEEQFAIVCQKGGINSERENYKLYRFEIEKYTE